MDPLDAIPPLGSRLPAPAAPARVARVERDERHPNREQDRSPGRHGDQDEAAQDDDLEDFYDEGWTERFTTRAQPPEDEPGSGTHVDIIA